MKEVNVDYIVIGGGTGGLRASLSCANKGKTVLFEPGTLGGTCLNTGCIPTKAMLHAAHVYESSKESTQFGVINKTTLNFPKLMNRVRGIVETGHNHIVTSVNKYVKAKKLIHVAKPAYFVDKNTVRAGNTTYKAKKILICTGAKNFIPPIKGLETVKYLDNESIIQLKKLPKSLIMVGGGYISMEFATFFKKLGVKVTVLERFPNMLGMLDEDIRETLFQSYTTLSLKVNINIISVKKSTTGVSITYNDVRDAKSAKKTISAEQLVVATGRVPNTRTLGLEKGGISVTPRGGIIVDNRLQTSNKKVFAMGDCTGQALFAHAAKREVEIMLHNLTSSKKREMNFDLMPWAVFTDPAVSGIGHSEQTATKAKISYETLTAPFTKAGRATVIGDTRGFVKVLYAKKTKKIIGASIIGPNADDMIHEFVALIQCNATIHELTEMIHVHPTLSEVVGSLK